MFPEKLDDWTYEVIEDLLNKNITETDTYDFKINFPKDNTLTKLCCAFANTKGGFVILDIKEDRNVSQNWEMEIGKSWLMLMLTVLNAYHSVYSASYQDLSAKSICLLRCNREWDQVPQSSCPLQYRSEDVHDPDILLWCGQDGLELSVSVLA